MLISALRNKTAKAAKKLAEKALFDDCLVGLALFDYRLLVLLLRTMV